MKVTGFTFICNAVLNDYPIVQAITSILPICQEFVVAVGKSDDETFALIKQINSPKIKIIETVWDNNIRDGGRTFAIETDRAYAQISDDTDWAFYIQGDEIVHEKYLPSIEAAMLANLNSPKVEGLLFKYLHFYGSYDYTASSRRWYRNEIRVLKFNKAVKSYRDAQGFRLDNRKIQVKPIDAYIYHYGWVKPPSGLGSKLRNFNKFYDNADWVAAHLSESDEFDYGNADRLIHFKDSHPLVMKKRIEASNWKFSVDPTLFRKKMTLRRKILQKIEDITGWRIGEYRNFTTI